VAEGKRAQFDRAIPVMTRSPSSKIKSLQRLIAISASIALLLAASWYLSSDHVAHQPFSDPNRTTARQLQTVVTKSTPTSAVSVDAIPKPPSPVENMQELHKLTGLLVTLTEKGVKRQGIFEALESLLRQPNKAHFKEVDKYLRELDALDNKFHAWKFDAEYTLTHFLISNNRNLFSALLGTLDKKAKLSSRLHRILEEIQAPSIGKTQRDEDDYLRATKAHDGELRALQAEYIELNNALYALARRLDGYLKQAIADSNPSIKRSPPILIDSVELYVKFSTNTVASKCHILVQVFIENRVLASGIIRNDQIAKDGKCRLQMETLYPADSTTSEGKTGKLYIALYNADKQVGYSLDIRLTYRANPTQLKELDHGENVPLSEGQSIERKFVWN
jgi:hypothetical protein